MPAHRAMQPTTRRMLVPAGSLATAALLALSLWGGPGHAQTMPAPTLKERFTAADKNRDGYIDREEYHQLIVETFYFRDKNRDGALDMSELEGTVSREAFRAANRKADGRLSIREWANALFIDFERADANGDGVLSYEEMEAYVRSSGR